MTRIELALKIGEFKEGLISGVEMSDAVDAYTAAVLKKCNVSRSVPVDSAIKEIENLMERWHLARDNDDETLQGINDVLVNIGLLGWFNRQ